MAINGDYMGHNTINQNNKTSYIYINVGFLFPSMSNFVSFG